jgi:ADP-L-glycero-D-manno-heptose 6-epimerase
MVPKWIVTGGAGLIGSVLLWKLNQEGIDDIWVVDRLDRSEKWKNLRGRRFSDYLDADRFLALAEAGKLPNAEGIVHLGAVSSTTETDAALLMRNNFQYTQTLARWAAAKKKRFVYASSAATYGDGAYGYSTDAETTFKLKPLNMYGYSKQLFDLWALREGLLKQIVGVKFFNIYGPNEYHKGDMRSVVAKAYEQIRAGGKVQLFKSYRSDFADGEQVRDFLYVKDAVQAVYEFMTQRAYKGLYNLGAGKARTWKDLAAAIFSALGKPLRIEYIDMPETLRPKYQYHTLADMRWREGAKRSKPFLSLEEAVADYVQNHLTQEDPYL